MYNFQIHNYINKMVKQRCQESGHVCPYWEDEKIYNDLRDLDNKDEGKRAYEYWRKCHDVYVSFNPIDNHVFVGCQGNNFEECDYENKQLAEQLKEEWKEGM